VLSPDKKALEDLALANAATEPGTDAVNPEDAEGAETDATAAAGSNGAAAPVPEPVATVDIPATEDTSAPQPAEQTSS